ncbi:MAG: hypothetical protein K2M90_07090, partial [Treponemataceae bacterium]|nr:hypothetical protein [Treponemataceae bacterium]
LKAVGTFLGEGKPSTSEAGFSLSQTSQGIALLNEFCFAKLALTLSQHGLGLTALRTSVRYAHYRVF